MKKTNYRWVICSMLFFATTINYLDRQVLSLTWKDFIAPDFHWTNEHYGYIAGFFTLVYAIGMLFAGRIVDWLDTKKGYLWFIGIWSAGACLHALCGVATEWWTGLSGEALKAVENADIIAKIVTVSVSLFMFARFVLAIGESGSFPVSIKATAEYFPKKDRAFATSIFNAGCTVGALIAPIMIPVIAKHYGWEMAFILIGALGFVWMGFWVFLYKKPEKNPKVNKLELEYILQDHENEPVADNKAGRDNYKLSILECFKYKQTWSFALGKFLTDGVWWFYLFWAPAYLSSVYHLKSSDPKSQIALFVLYFITLLAIVGGWLPSYFVNKKGMDPYSGRMRAMLIFAFFPLLSLLAQPLGSYSYWYPIVIIGIAGAAHQAWSANIFSTVGDMFPKPVIATVTGIGGMAGGIGAFLINVFSGILFDHADKTGMKFMGFEGIESGYFIIFSVCSVAYLAGWIVMKSLVPKFQEIRL